MRGIVRGKQLLDTNRGWFALSWVLLVAGITAHQVAMSHDLYENPPHPDLRIDVYTHALTSIALVSLFLNLNFGRESRWRYLGFPILVAFAVGVVWEFFEEAVIRLDIIHLYNTGWNALQDLFMDTLGGITAGYFGDAVIE